MWGSTHMAILSCVWFVSQKSLNVARNLLMANGFFGLRKCPFVCNSALSTNLKMWLETFLSQRMGRLERVVSTMFDCSYAVFPNRLLYGRVWLRAICIVCLMVHDDLRQARNQRLSVGIGKLLECSYHTAREWLLLVSLFMSLPLFGDVQYDFHLNFLAFAWVQYGLSSNEWDGNDGVSVKGIKECCLLFSSLLMRDCSLRFLRINSNTGRMSQKDAKGRLAKAFMSVMDCVQRSMLRYDTSSSAPFCAVFIRSCTTK